MILCIHKNWKSFENHVDTDFLGCNFMQNSYHEISKKNFPKMISSSSEISIARVKGYHSNIIRGEAPRNILSTIAYVTIVLLPFPPAIEASAFWNISHGNS